MSDNQSNLQSKWYIIQTYVGFEDAVKKTLEQKIANVPNLSSKILEIFIPTKSIIKLNAKGERKEKIEKIYPGYIYIHMMMDREVAYIIQNTSYVSRITGTGEIMVALENGYVEKLKENLLLQSQNKQTTTKIVFKIGDLVKVVEGPFKDMQGKVSGIDPQNNRINVLLTIFDRETDVELDVLEVKKVL
jgi:transcription termination/antitermination protein NusG